MLMMTGHLNQISCDLWTMKRNVGPIQSFTRAPQESPHDFAQTTLHLGADPVSAEHSSQPVQLGGARASQLDLLNDAHRCPPALSFESERVTQEITLLAYHGHPFDQTFFVLDSAHFKPHAHPPKPRHFGLDQPAARAVGVDDDLLNVRHQIDERARFIEEGARMRQFCPRFQMPAETGPDAKHSTPLSNLPAFAEDI
jgi:hypothetical protein